MTILEKLKRIEKSKIIYNIHYCNAGVGFTFYEPIEGLVDPANNWQQCLTTNRYYPTFSKAVSAEFKRLLVGDAK